MISPALMQAQCHLWDLGLGLQLHLALEGDSEAILKGT